MAMLVEGWLSRGRGRSLGFGQRILKCVPQAAAAMALLIACSTLLRVESPSRGKTWTMQEHCQWDAGGICFSLRLEGLRKSTVGREGHVLALAEVAVGGRKCCRCNSEGTVIDAVSWRSNRKSTLQVLCGMQPMCKDRPCAKSIFVWIGTAASGCSDQMLDRVPRRSSRQ